MKEQKKPTFIDGLFVLFSIFTLLLGLFSMAKITVSKAEQFEKANPVGEKQKNEVINSEHEFAKEIQEDGIITWPEYELFQEKAQKDQRDLLKAEITLNAIKIKGEEEIKKLREKVND
jgi:hypothetical protein